MNTIGENIKRIRTERGLSLRQLARVSGVNHSYIEELEIRERNNPTIKVLLKLSKALDVSIDELIKGVEV